MSRSRRSMDNSLSSAEGKGISRDEIRRAAKAAVGEEDVKDAPPVLSLLGAVSGDQSLDLALRPLVGMEGSLLLNFGEVSQNENVMAWIVHEVRWVNYCIHQ